MGFVRDRETHMWYNFLHFEPITFSTLKLQRKQLLTWIHVWRSIPDPNVVATCRFLKLMCLEYAKKRGKWGVI